MDKSTQATERRFSFNGLTLVQKMFNKASKQKAKLAAAEKNQIMHANKAAKAQAKLEKLANKAQEKLTKQEADYVKTHAADIKAVQQGETANIVKKQLRAAEQAGGQAANTATKMAKGTRKSLANGGTLNINTGGYNVTHGPKGKRSGGIEISLKDVKDKKGNIKTALEAKGTGTTKAGQATGNNFKAEDFLNKEQQAKVNKAAEGPKIETGNKSMSRKARRKLRRAQNNTLPKQEIKRAVEKAPTIGTNGGVVTETANKVITATTSTAEKAGKVATKAKKLTFGKKALIAGGVAAGVAGIGAGGYAAYKKGKENKKAAFEKK